jgi:hypothetical protein
MLDIPHTEFLRTFGYNLVSKQMWTDWNIDLMILYHGFMSPKRTLVNENFSRGFHPNASNLVL